jgi:uncharacterized protein (TIGR00297 family)
VTAEIERAVGYLLVGSLTLVAPVLDGRVDASIAAVGTVGPLALVAIAALASTDGPVFEFFAREADRENGRLYSLGSFALAIVALAVLFVALGLPLAALVAAVFTLTVGNLAQRLVGSASTVPIVGASSFAVVGTLGGTGAVLAAGQLGSTVPPLAALVFASASGAVIGALVRSTLSPLDDPIVVLSVGLVIWFLLGLGIVPSVQRLAIGVVVTVALGFLAYALGTASTTGTLSGVVLALWAVVLGGYGWFVLLVTFFGLGGLASKYRYDEKVERGIAQENEGARGGGNVLANSAAALVAVVAYAGASGIGGDAIVFQFAFVGSVAAALADTFSSEFGGLFDSPRLVTTLEHVPAGTDGGVTWQGVVAGAIGSGIIAGLARVFFEFDDISTAALFGAGLFGMVIDSILGATLEGERLGNQAVNLLATLSAGVAAGAIALLA